MSEYRFTIIISGIDYYVIEYRILYNCAYRIYTVYTRIDLVRYRTIGYRLLTNNSINSYYLNPTANIKSVIIPIFCTNHIHSKSVNQYQTR